MNLAVTWKGLTTQVQGTTVGYVMDQHGIAHAIVFSGERLYQIPIMNLTITHITPGPVMAVRATAD